MVTLYNPSMIFSDRRAAGRKLAEALLYKKQSHPVVLALARGGVPVGFEVAMTLSAPLQVLIVRKIGLPSNPELGIGAVAEGKICVWEQEEEFADLQKKAEQEVQERISRYRQKKPLPQLTGKTAIIVDDGLATGVTARAAIEAVKELHPNKIVLAAPVGAPETIQKLRELVDDVICLHTPEYLEAIGAYYHNFEQLSDEEVIQLLQIFT